MLFSSNLISASTQMVISGQYMTRPPIKCYGDREGIDTYTENRATYTLKHNPTE